MVQKAAICKPILDDISGVFSSGIILCTHDSTVTCPGLLKLHFPCYHTKSFLSDLEVSFSSRSSRHGYPEHDGPPLKRPRRLSENEIRPSSMDFAVPFYEDDFSSLRHQVSRGIRLTLLHYFDTQYWWYRLSSYGRRVWVIVFSSTIFPPNFFNSSLVPKWSSLFIIFKALVLKLRWEFRCF